MDAGAIGVCCAKVGEAEVMVEAGVTEVMIPNQVIGKRNIARLVALAHSANIIVAVESAGNVDDLSSA